MHEQCPDPTTCSRHYAMGFQLALESGNRMCLCGLLGAEYHELPEPIQAEVQGFIDDNVAWLENEPRSWPDPKMKGHCPATPLNGMSAINDLLIHQQGLALGVICRADRTLPALHRPHSNRPLTHTPS